MNVRPSYLWWDLCRWGESFHRAITIHRLPEQRQSTHERTMSRQWWRCTMASLRYFTIVFIRFSIRIDSNRYIKFVFSSILSNNKEILCFAHRLEAPSNHQPPKQYLVPFSNIFDSVLQCFYAEHIWHASIASNSYVMAVAVVAAVWKWWIFGNHIRSLVCRKRVASNGPALLLRVFWIQNPLFPLRCRCSEPR